MAKGIERHFDQYNWMISGESKDGTKVDVVKYGPDYQDVFVAVEKEFAENLVAIHNYHLQKLQEQLIKYGYDKTSTAQYTQLSLDLEI